MLEPLCPRKRCALSGGRAAFELGVTLLSRPPGAAVRASFALLERGHAVSKCSVPASGSNKPALPMLRHRCSRRRHLQGQISVVFQALKARSHGVNSLLLYTHCKRASSCFSYGAGADKALSCWMKLAKWHKKHVTTNLACWARGDNVHCQMSKAQSSGGCPELCTNWGAQGFGCKVRRGGAQEDKNFRRVTCVRPSGRLGITSNGGFLAKRN